MKRINKKAFTLAEMMVVMLILTIVMAAAAPLVTKRKMSSDTIWRWAANNTDIYYGMGDKQSVMIGQNSKANDDPNSKLIINASNENKNSYILFKNGTTKRAELSMSGSSIILGTPRSQSTTDTGNDNTAMGLLSLYSNTTGYSNVAMGLQSLYSNTTGYENTAIGNGALYSNTTGYGNVAMGTQSLYSNTTGYGNVAMGTQSLYSNNGTSNTAMGVLSLYSNTSGSGNTAIGNSALGSNTTGSENTAIGNGALGSNTTSSANIAIGSGALGSNTTGSENTAIGNDALKNGGTHNTAVGHQALNKTNGTENTAIGTYALKGNSSGSFNTAVGYRALGGDTTTNPNYNVAVGGLSLATVEGSFNTAVGYQACNKVKGTGNICIGGSGVPRNIEGNNQIYIGTNSHEVKVIGNLSLQSDKRLKNIKSEFKYGIESLRSLTTYNFTYKDDKTNKNRIGIIAQDLQKAVPQLVKKDSNGYLSIQQEGITYMMLNAIKQLDTIVQALIGEVKVDLKRVYQHDAEIKALQKQNAELIKQNQELAKRITRLEKLIEK